MESESIVDIAIRSERSAFMRGAEAGFWKGFAEGAEANRKFIMGLSDDSPFEDVPPQYAPLGKDYFPHSFAKGE
jgi:hypothetical protein